MQPLIYQIVATISMALAHLFFELPLQVAQTCFFLHCHSIIFSVSVPENYVCQYIAYYQDHRRVKILVLPKLFW